MGEKTRKRNQAPETGETTFDFRISDYFVLNSWLKIVPVRGNCRIFPRHVRSRQAISGRTRGEKEWSRVEPFPMPPVGGAKTPVHVDQRGFRGKTNSSGAGSALLGGGWWGIKHADSLRGYLGTGSSSVLGLSGVASLGPETILGWPKELSWMDAGLPDISISAVWIGSRCADLMPFGGIPGRLFQGQMCRIPNP